MPQTSSKRLWLVVPVWLWLVADVSLTLVGQPDSFWDGDYTTALEANPIVHPILTLGPGPFILLAILWAMFCGLFVVYFPYRLVTWFVLIAALSHAFGGCTWLVRLGTWGWILAAAYLFVAAEVSWWCWGRFDVVANEKGAEPEGSKSMSKTESSS